MTAETDINLKAGRRQVARSRGALSGMLLVVLGAWAAIVPFIGPYLDLAFTPSPNDSWHWTSGRGWLEVLPGCVAVFGGLLLLVSASRFTTLLGGWLGALSGAWLVVGPSLSEVLNIDIGGPDPSSGEGARAAEELLFFFGIGAAILFVGAVALGRLSVHSVRDVRAAERRAEAEAAEERRLAEERRATAEADERRRAEEQQRGDDTGYPGPIREPDAGPQGYPAGSGGYQGQHAGRPGEGAPPYEPPPPNAPPNPPHR